MNNFLKTFLKVGLEIAKSQVPAIAAVETAVKDLKQGKNKKKAVVEITKASPVIAELIANKEIVDEELFARGIDKLNDGYVDILNSLRKEEE